MAITGAGGGIGRAVALAAAAEGARVVVADIGVGLAGEDPKSEVAEALVADIEAAGGEAVAVGESVTTLDGGEKIIGAGVERWGRIDGVVAIAGILRERMLFNMAEDEWDAVIETHLKGHFTVFRAASAVMRKQEGGGSLVAFTSGAFAGSVAQANYAAAKGGIVSLVRSAAAGLNRYGITANAVAPVARTRMSANVPMDLAEMGDPEDVAPLVVYLLSDRAKHVTGQVYTSVGPKIAVWNQPQEVRAVYADGRWTPEDIAARLDSTVGQERMPLLDQLEAYRKAAEAKAAAEAEGRSGDRRRFVGRCVRSGPSGGAEHAELVPFGVGHDHPVLQPALSHGDAGGAHLLQARHLVGLIFGAQVEVEPVLDGLRLGYAGEEQGTDLTVVGVPVPRLHPDVTVLVGRVLPSEGLRPEAPQGQRIGGVDGDGLDSQCHGCLLGPAG